MNRRLRGLLPLMLSLGLSAAGCKRNTPPTTPEVWDDAPGEHQSGAGGTLSPRWPAPAVAVLDNGLLQWWLEEPGAATAHLRLLLPLHSDASNEVTAVVAEAVRHELARRLRARNVQVEIGAGPGRFEVALHGPGSELPAMLERLSTTLATPDPSRGLLAAQKRLASAQRMRDATDVAIDHLVQQLLPDQPGGGVDPTALMETTRVALTSGWHRLADPRRAVLLVHADGPPQAHAAATAALGARWQGRGRQPASTSATARLRTPATPPEGGQRLAVAPGSAPLFISSTPAVGGAVVAMGCVLSTPRGQDRALARLAQRVVQEELDVRLTISGSHALWIVVVPLAGPDAAAELERALAHLSGLAQQRQPRQRLYQAAELWLGGRVVRASLTGEDWTALLSEALDLADTDAAARDALGRDAQFMLDADPELLKTWQEQLDPQRAGAAWHWTLAGAPPRVVEALETSLPTRRRE